MTALNRLTTLERVRDWAGITATSEDVLITRLIDETSRFILSYLQRPTLFQYVFSDVYDGGGQRSQILRHWPVQSVALVTVDGLVIPSSTGAPQPGYLIEPWDQLPPGRPQLVRLQGYEFSRGYGNVNIVYTAGFTVTNEAQTVPGSGNYTVAPNAPHGSFGLDLGVNYANGMAFACVTASPAVGQYSVTGGIYTFAAADAGASIRLNYSYIPADIEHACMEMAAERYRYRSRIGEISKSLGGQETISFNQKDIPDFIRTLLQPYRRVILV